MLSHPYRQTEMNAKKLKKETVDKNEIALKVLEELSWLHDKDAKNSHWHDTSECSTCAVFTRFKAASALSSTTHEEREG